jgi:hypothetical protein
MRFLLQLDFSADAAELALNAIDLMLRGLALLAIQFQRRRAGQSLLRPAHNGHHHLQIAQQFGAWSGRGFLLGLPLCFEEQFGSFQNAVTDRGRAFAPSRI